MSHGGTNQNWVYNIHAQMNDNFTWQNRSFLIARSQGNTGTTTTMRNEATAKNVLAVGATENKVYTPGFAEPPFASSGLPDKLWAGSSRGPTEDGRIKPNVVAPGACVKTGTWNLPISPTLYKCVAGTSYSTPAAAGGAALVRDYFAKGYHPSGNATPADKDLNVSAALLRAILQVSGEKTILDSNPQLPNNDFGWGRVNLEEVLYFYGDARRLLVRDEDTASLTTGQAWSREFNVAGTHEPLEIMLAWTDHQGTLGASKAIINDLDLKVNITLPSGQDIVYIGNNFPASGEETPAGVVTPDRLNVEERVYRTGSNLVAGKYRVTVTAFDIPKGPQNFALIILGDVSWV